MSIIDKITNIIGRKGSRHNIKKRLDNLQIGETYYDPYTQTRYECIGKFVNGESMTITRSFHIEVI